MVISRRQFRDFASDVDRPGGGGSINMLSGETPAPSGYMVSTEGSEARIPQGSLTTRATVAYARAHQSALSRPAAFLGGWNSGGTNYIDVSERHPDFGGAMTAGRRQHQLAIYDIDRDESFAAPRASRRVRQRQLGMAPRPRR